MIKKLANPKIESVFVEVLKERGRVRAAAEAAGITPPTVYNRKNENVEFARKFEDAKEQYYDKLEEEAARRAYEGRDKPVFYQGKIVGVIKEQSDQLLMFLLTGGRPEKYAKRAVEMTGKDGKDLIPQMDDIEAARRMAWLLTQGAAAKKKQDALPPITLAPMPDKENESGRSE